MTKIISLSDEAYARLKRIKGDKSFTKVVLELTEQKKSLVDYAGIWKDRDDLKEIYDDILKERQKQIHRKLPSW